MTDKLTKPETEWRAQLSPEEYYVTREKVQSAHLPVSTTIPLSLVPIAASVAAKTFLTPMQSLIPVAVGLAIGSPLILTL